MILRPFAAEYFKNYDLRYFHASNFMTITYNVTDECKIDSPAITHVGNTA